MDRETELTQKRYNRTSRFYDFMDRMIKQELRQKVLGQATGKVLEVGVGTGKNFPFYTTRCIDVTCIDLSPGMLTKAKAHGEFTNPDYPMKYFPKDSKRHGFNNITWRDRGVWLCALDSLF